jgi:hypothetical protein
MISKIDLEDCSQFWDCPNLCVGAKPKQPKRKKGERHAPLIFIPAIPPLPPIQEMPRIEDLAFPRMRSSQESQYDSAPFSSEEEERDRRDQVEEVEALTGNAGWKTPEQPKPDGSGRKRCQFCHRTAESEDRLLCWLHGGPGDGEPEKRDYGSLALLLLVAAVVGAIALLVR